jgi:hypothetical protein
MCLAKTVFAVFTLLVTGCLTAWPQTNATAIATVPTQVVIIGTIHDGPERTRITRSTFFGTSS